jgi:uncharacterized RDD family membrane protein YckC
MVYATFGQRFLAALIDALVFLPLIFGPLLLQGASKPIDIFTMSLLSLVGWLYNVYFHARWGQTIGKMAMKIRVVRVGGSRIGWGNALRRHSVDGVFAILSMIAQGASILHVPDAQYAAAGWMERAKLLADATPTGLRWVNTAAAIWGWGEILTMLSNRRRRALHDFLGGTVVVKTGV